jgi:hypothetical protein
VILKLGLLLQKELPCGRIAKESSRAPEFVLIGRPQEKRRRIKMTARPKKAKTKKPQLKVRDLKAKKNAVGGLKEGLKEHGLHYKY